MYTPPKVALFESGIDIREGKRQERHDSRKSQEKTYMVQGPSAFFLG